MRRRALPVALVALLGGALLAGCLGDPDPTVEVTPYLRVLEVAPGRTVALAAHVQSLDAFKQDLDVRVEGLPQRWSANVSAPTLALPGRASSALVVNVTLPPDARFGAHDVRLRVGDAAATVTLDVRDAGATVAGPGAGVRLEYVAWAGNGSIVRSNAPALRNQSEIPRAEANATALGLPEASNGTLVGHLPDGAASIPEGRAALPPSWQEALLGTVAGDLVWVRVEDAPRDLAPVGALLRVLEVEAPEEASDAPDGP